MRTVTRTAPRPDSRFAAAVPLVAVGAAFLAMFDATVINLAIPDLARDHTSATVTDLTWTITLYAVVFAALLAPAGRLADVLGHRTVYLVGMGLFTVASLLCAVSPNLPALFAGRALQGAGAAVMVPASLALLLRYTPPDRIARAIGLWGATSAVAAAIGPSAGGVLVDALHWRSLFYVNLPVGVVLLCLIPALPRSEAGGGKWPDLLGTALLGLGIGAVVLGVAQGQSWHWTDARTVGSTSAGALMLAFALLRSVRHPVPAIETVLWRTRQYAMANLGSFCYGAALFPWLLVGVLYLTEVWHYSELEAGLAQSPGAVTAAVSALMVSRVTARYGPWVAISGGAAIMIGVSAWIHTLLTPHPQFLTFWLPTGLVVGVGMGALASGVSSAAAMAVAPRRFAAAIGLNTAARQVGGALGIAALAAILPLGAAAEPGDYLDVYLFCGAVSLVSVVAGVLVALGGRRGAGGDPP
ncbi:MFS transporter [Actinomadura graeca]|uniref:MFS transporter n=1 Tax=Actinomadura graeca TaxID=2750812 RepID=A0ABX8QRJ7_9ACTN|nr:MFS transporter [Actinomadura graeca]QXJ21430.1 MFS transporter [Actinomadura graeca]